MKRCWKCKTSKSLAEFSKDSRNKDGLDSRCKACTNAHYVVNREERLAVSKAYSHENPERRRLSHLASNANSNVRRGSGITLPYSALFIDVMRELQVVQGTTCWYEHSGHCRLPGEPMLYVANTGDTMVSLDHIVPRKYFKILQDLHKSDPTIPWKDPNARWNLALVHLRCNLVQGVDFIEGLRSPLTGEIVRHVLPAEYLSKDSEMETDIAYMAGKDRT